MNKLKQIKKYLEEELKDMDQIKQHEETDEIVIGRQELAEALIDKFFKEEIKWPIENY